LKKTLLFDLDGTLIDSTKAIVEGFFTSFEQNGAVLPRKESIYELIGYPLEIMFASLGVDKARVDDFVSAYKSHYRKIAAQKTVLLPNALEAIKEAAEFANIGVVTTKTRKYSLEILEKLEVLDYFETVVGRECVTNPKPHPEPVLEAIGRMGKEKKGCYLIGDTMLDLLASEAAGIEFVGVDGFYGDTELFRKSCKELKSDALVAVRFIKERKV